MFVGHYGPSYGGKAQDAAVPLWVLFLSVQFLDVLWGAFVLLGIEKVRIVPGITATNPLDLYYMPYSHGLLTALGWSVVAGLVYRAWKGRDGAGTGPLLVGAAVFSHWILDFLVHRPDLPLVGNELKVGLGLWNFPVPALLLETLFLFGGMALYLRTTERVEAGGTAGFFVFGAALVAVQCVVFFGAPPESARAAALTALVSYAVFAGVAAWLEPRRRSTAALAAPGTEPAATG